MLLSLQNCVYSFSVTNLLFGLGGAVGAPLGAFLGDTIGWRKAFLIQTPFLCFGLVLIFIAAKEPAHVLSIRQTSLAYKLKRIDYAGTITLTSWLLDLQDVASFRCS